MKHHPRIGRQLTDPVDLNTDAIGWRVLDIVKAISIATRIAPADITNSRIRSPAMVTARWAVITLAHKIGYSLPHIGKHVGLDHSTVINAMTSMRVDDMHARPRSEEIAAIVAAARTRLEQAQAAFDAVMVCDEIRPASRPAPPPAPVAKPSDEPTAPAVKPPVRSRVGFVNRHGEIIVGAPRHEAT